MGVEFIGRVAFDTIYEMNVDMVFNTALKAAGNYHTAEEVTQETFVRLYTYMNRVNPDKISGWLKVTAKNMALNRKRNKYEFLVNEVYSGDSYAEPVRSSEDEFIRKLREKELEVFTENLFEDLYMFNSRWYEAVTMTYILDKPHRDTAEVMGITVEALNSMIYRAKKWMRKKYESQYVQKNKA